jgi:hydroxypyruvate isomerase
MPRFAANLSMMFTEWAFLDRFAAAADAGFTAVEFLFPYEHPAEAIGARLKAAKLTQALFNLPPGDSQKGERGTAVFPERFEEFKAGIEMAIPYAAATGVGRVHLMAGLASPSDARAGEAYRRALRWASERLAREGLTTMIEPLNGRDVPGYFLNDFAAAEALIRELAIPSLKLQFDIYHRQILHGDVAMGLRAMMPIIGHIQIASVPSRAEPSVEELNYPFLFAELDRLGYDGFVGCEYRPRAGTLAGLDWFKPYAGKR